MAINKNFVIKNGVEVNTSLIVGDATLNKVGVGTTVPGYTLHVGGSRGGIGATDITITGIATVGTSGSTSAALSVVGVSTFQGDIILLGSAGVSTISFDASLDKLNFADNARATFGTGNDLQIYHEGTYSYISNQSGDLRIDAKEGERGVVVTGGAPDSSVELYYDNTKTFNTTPQGINVVGVTTSLRLNVSGISTLDGGVVIGSATSIFANGNVAFAGLATANGGVQVGTAASIYTNGNIAAAGIVTANGGLAVGAAVTLASNGNAGFAGIVTAKGVIDANGGINAASAKIEDLTDNRVIIAGTSGELEDDSNFTFDGAMLKVGTAATVAVNGNAAFAGIVTVGGDLKVIGDIEISEDLVLNTNLNLLGIASISNLDNTGAGIGSLSVTGVSTFSGDLIVGVSTFFVDKSTGRIGIGTNVPSAALQVGATAGTGIGVSIHENGNAGFTGIVTVGGVIDANGGINASSAKIEDLTNNRVVIAGSGGELEDDADLTFDGSNLTVGGVFGKLSVTNSGAGVTAFTNGNLIVSGISTLKGNVFVGTGVTIQPHGGVSIAGITTIGGNLNVTGNSYFVGMVTFAGGTNGNITLGDSSGDNVVFNADVNSNVIPNTTNTYDLGSASQQWKDIYVDGIGYIDTVSADGVGIATATIRDSAKLDVDGDARFSGKVAVKDGGNAGAGVTIFDNGNIAASGIITASTFVGSFSGTVTTATNVTVADESSDTECFPLFATAATGDLAPKSGSNLTFNSNTGALTATSFAGNLTGGTVSGTTGTLSGDLSVGISTLFADVSTGRVGIGTDVPGSTLEIATGSGTRAITINAPTLGPYIAFETDGTAFADIGSLSGVIGSGSDTDTLALNARGSRDLAFRTNSNERLRITSTGLIGINTTPGTLLELKGESGKEAEITFNRQGVQGTNDGVIGQLFFENATDSVAQISVKRESAADDAYIQFATQATSGGLTERLRITSAGRVNAVGIVSATGGVQVAAAATIAANGNAGFTGIVTATGGFNIGIQSAGIVIAQNVGINTLNFLGAGNSITYHAASNTLGIDIAGSGGGGSETDTSVSSTSATGVGSFAVATHRSASIIAQIDQGGSYQVGRYLMIHDGETATVIEESAIATGDMLGSFSADVNNSNAELKVTMNNSGIATVTTKIDTVTV